MTDAPDLGDEKHVYPIFSAFLSLCGIPFIRARVAGNTRLLRTHRTRVNSGTLFLAFKKR
jgi:hypothetical protein